MTQHCQKPGSNRFNTGGINIYLFSRVYLQGNHKVPCGFEKKVHPHTPEMAGLARRLWANTSSWWQDRRAGPPLPRWWGPPGDRLHAEARQLAQELAPGTRATRLMSLLVTLSVSGRPGWCVERPPLLWPARPCCGDEPPDPTTTEGPLCAPAEEEARHGLSHPGAAAAVQQVRRSLCSYPGSQSSFFFYSSPSLFASKCVIWVIFYTIAGQVGRKL